MLCSSERKEKLNGLGRFDKDTIIKVCQYTLDSINSKRNMEKIRILEEIKQELLRDAKSWKRYFNLSHKIEHINEELCKKIFYTRASSRIFHPYMHHYGWYCEQEDTAEKILNLCKKTQFKSIFLAGNDVDKLFWPKDESIK